MNIDNTSQDVSLPLVRGQMDASTAVVRQGGSGNDPSVTVTLQKGLNIQNQQGKQSVLSAPSLFHLKASYAVTQDHEVVIQFTDDKGNKVEQLPPESYLNMIRQFNEVVKNLFSKKV